MLILRVLVPGLEARLRDKMKEVEETAPKPSSHGGSDSADKGTLLDLDGVHCEPTADGSDLWNFHCDGGNILQGMVYLLALICYILRTDWLT